MKQAGLARGAAIVFLGAGTSALACIAAESVRAGVASLACPLALIALVAALVFLIASRSHQSSASGSAPRVPARFGEGKTVRDLAWIAAIIIGVPLAALVLPLAIVSLVDILASAISD